MSVTTDGAQKPESRPADATGRLLIVDDVADNRNILRRRFAALGFQTAEAENGVAAVRLIEQQQFDLVLLDIVMPGIDGIEVLKRIRTKHTADSLPVIMVSGQTCSSATVIQAFESGANDYVSKPVDFSIAAVRVKSQLARRESQMAMRREIDELEEANRKLREEAAEHATAA